MSRPLVPQQANTYLPLALAHTQAVGWLLLAVYLDNVLPGPNKRARPPWYFLMPSYWVSRGDWGEQEGCG